MKRMLLLCLLLSIFHVLKSQVPVTTYNTPQVRANGFFNVSTPLKELVLPAINLAAIQAADKQEGSDKPFRFAAAIPVNINPQKDGSWTDDGNMAIWRARISSRKAYSMSINFSKFRLPEGSVMYIYNSTGDMVLGPVTAAENNIYNTWGSSVMKGASLVIELKVPSAAKQDLVLQADEVAHGYKNIYDKNFGDAGNCNNNVLCPVGNVWEGERRSVALLLLANDTRWCSGALVNNANNTDIPYLLTAFHCVSGQSVTNWKFIFHYWSPTCMPNQNGSTSLLFNHADLRASYSPSDFALLQLQQTPAAGSGITYAGWSRSVTPPANTTAIHHPSGDVMKITFDNQAAVKTAYGGAPGNNHWQVNWDLGVTEPGSSGSPLFDQNHRIRGQLHGGPSSCTSSDKRDFYGSTDISWTGGGTNSTRLSNWLDPSNLGVTTTDTRLAGTSLAPGSPVNTPVASPVHLFTVNPNPATDQVVVTLQKAVTGATHDKALQLTAEQADISLTYIRDVRIYDAAGKLRKHQRFNGAQPRVQLSVSGLQAGIYFVEVSDGKNKSVEEIIIH